MEEASTGGQTALDSFLLATKKMYYFGVIILNTALFKFLVLGALSPPKGS